MQESKEEIKRGRPKLNQEQRKVKKSVQMTETYWLILDSLGLARGEAIQHLLDKYFEDEENNRN